jgi:hypothetical protein
MSLFGLAGLGLAALTERLEGLPPNPLNFKVFL